jgi:hypothetical protein
VISFHDTQAHITVGRTPLDEGSARRRDLYVTTQTLYRRQTSMSPVGFEPTIPASARPQTYALDWRMLKIPTSAFSMIVYLHANDNRFYSTEACFTSGAHINTNNCVCNSRYFFRFGQLHNSCKNMQYVLFLQIFCHSILLY